jgi:hypothetical protein
VAVVQRNIGAPTLYQKTIMPSFRTKNSFSLQCKGLHQIFVDKLKALGKKKRCLVLLLTLGAKMQGWGGARVCPPHEVSKLFGVGNRDESVRKRYILGWQERGWVGSRVVLRSGFWSHRPEKSRYICKTLSPYYSVGYSSVFSKAEWRLALKC